MAKEKKYYPVPPEKYFKKRVAERLQRYRDIPTSLLGRNPYSYPPLHPRFTERPVSTGVAQREAPLSQPEETDPLRLFSQRVIRAHEKGVEGLPLTPGSGDKKNIFTVTENALASSFSALDPSNRLKGESVADAAKRFRKAGVMWHHVVDRYPAIARAIPESARGRGPGAILMPPLALGAAVKAASRMKDLPEEEQKTIAKIGKFEVKKTREFGPPTKAQKTIASLTLTLGADPSMALGIGALTKTGKAAQLVKSPLQKLSTSLARQAELGERAALMLYGKPILPKNLSVAALRQVDRTKEALGRNEYFKAFNKLFISPTGNSVTDYISRKSKAFKDYLTSKWTDQSMAIKRKYRRPKGTKKESYNLAVSDYMERGKELPENIKLQVPEPVRKAAEELKPIQDDILKTELDNGIFTSELDGDIDYLARIVSPEGKKFLKKKKGLGENNFPGSFYEWTPAHASQLQRQFIKGKDEFGNILHYTKREANAIMSPEMEKLGIKGEFFISDPFVSTSIRGERASRAIAARKMIDETTDFFIKKGDAQALVATNSVMLKKEVELIARGQSNKGIYLDRRVFKGIASDLDKLVDPEINKGVALLKARLSGADVGDLVDISQLLAQDDSFSVLKALTKLRGKKRVGFVLPTDVAEELNKVHNVSMYGKWFIGRAFLKSYDGALNWWKGWTLGIFPAYHIRNALGNFLNNAYAGVTDPVYYAMGYRHMLSYHMAKRRGTMLTPEIGEGIEEALKRGVLKKGLFDVEFLRTMDDVSSGGNWNLLSTRGHIVETGRKFGQFIEDSAKLTHFLYKRDEGLRALEQMRKSGQKIPKNAIENIYDNAALSVKKYLFDYSEITDHERKVMRRLFPFYTWMRKNASLQIRTAFETPGKVATYEKLRGYVGSEVSKTLDEKYVADWIKRNYPVQFKTLEDGTPVFALLGSWLPVADIYKLMYPYELTTSSFSPFIKEIIEQAANYDFFFENTIDEGTWEVPEMRMFLNTYMPNRAAHVLRNIRLLNEIDKMFFKYGAGELPMGDRVVRYLTGFREFSQDPVRAMIHYDKEIMKDLNRYKDMLRDMAFQIQRTGEFNEGMMNQVDRIGKAMAEGEQEMQQLGEDFREFQVQYDAIRKMMREK